MKIVVLIPCYNEEATKEEVAHDFLRCLPDASIIVFDNNSTDQTAAMAVRAGATARRIAFRGKENVASRMFANINADAYLLVDEDGTYAAEDAPVFLRSLVEDNVDMVVGARASAEKNAAYRRRPRLSNKLLTGFAALIFGWTLSDMLSGYRVFSRRFVESFPAHSAGFEIETELTVHALELGMPGAEFPTEYRSRPTGSASKLNTYRDGTKILLMIVRLVRAERPLSFNSTGAAICALLSIVLALPVFDTFVHTGLVPRLPAALVCTALMLFGAILLACGVTTDTATRGRTEAKWLAYLQQPAVLPTNTLP